MPPSPRLSSRMTTIRYLTLTIRISGACYQREDAIDSLRGRVETVGPLETFPERVEQTRADVAVDNSKGAQRQRGEATPAGRIDARPAYPA
jgi:hypothetical protein